VQALFVNSTESLASHLLPVEQLKVLLKHFAVVEILGY